MRKQQSIRLHDSTAIINYSITISNLVNVLKQYNYEGDLQSSSTLQVAIEKLPPNLKEKWFFFVDECQEDRPDLTLLEKWLARMAFVHEGMPSTKSEQKEDDRPNANKEKRFSKSSNVTASSNANETKQMQNNNCPLADSTHKIWNCPIFKNMNVTDRYAAVRKERLCYGCLGKGHAIKDCKVHPCGINGCTKKHNRLLHSENQMDECNRSVNVSAATINQSNQVTGFLQIVPVSVQSGSNRLTTYAFLDSGSTVSFIDQIVKGQLQAKGTDVILNIAGIHGTQDLRTKKVPITIKGLHSKVHSIEAFAHPSISLGNTTYDYKELKNKFRHLNVLTNRRFNLMEGTFGKEWYLPHHPVLNPNKPGKVRRVCNAAAKYKDICLNDKLLAGPDLLHGLIGIIFRFREGPIALTADIESMFLQVQVPERDKSCLRFLWRPRMNEPVQIYEYQRHVFRAKSSPICANYALKRVAIDNEDEFPIAAKTIKKNFYMDDFIKSPEETIEVFKQLQPLLSKHGFELKKWITNSNVVTNAIPEDLRSISKTKQVEVEPSQEGSSVLGLQWAIIDDSLQVCRGTSKKVETPIPQRKILSLVSSVFDPLGLFAPFSVHMRRLLKSIWTKNGQHWDNSVEPNEEEEFLKWKAQLPEVAETSIDRRYFSTAKDKWELHVFADASEDTMCAVAYLRSKPKEYSAELAFVIGKRRVAPMRHLSIPRLELQAAVMAVRLKEQIVKEQESKIQSCNFWTDSTTVLQWIHSSHRKQQVFVANRVAEILDTTNVSQWNHMSRVNDPADIGTRAINVDEFKRSEWLTWPAWLRQRENEWPEQVNLTFASDEQNDQMVFSAKVEEKKPMIQWERFSNFNRLVNTMAYVQRVFKKHIPATKTLSVEEREDAQASISRLLQQEQFTEEMKSLLAER